MGSEWFCRDVSRCQLPTTPPLWATTPSPVLNCNNKQTICIWKEPLSNWSDKYRQAISMSKKQQWCEFKQVSRDRAACRCIFQEPHCITHYLCLGKLLQLWLLTAWFFWKLDVKVRTPVFSPQNCTPHPVTSPSWNQWNKSQNEAGCIKKCEAHMSRGV